MMQIIRDKAHGIVAWTIMVVIILAFCSWGVSAHLGGTEPVVAKVNGNKIPLRRVEEIYNHWFRAVSNQKNFDVSKVDPAQIKQQIIQSMAEQQAVVSGLISNHFGISDQILIANIQSDPAMQEDGKFSIERYKTLLSQNNIEEDIFEEAKRNELLITQAQQAFVISSFQLKSEVENMLSIRDQRRDFGYALIPADKYTASVKIEDKQIEEFYTKHKDNFIIPEKVKIEYIELSINNLMKNNKIDEQALREYYKNSVQHFNDPELYHVRHIMISVPQNATAEQKNQLKGKIDAIYTKVKSGANFADLAKSDSDDKQSSVKGGDLGWVSKNDQLPPQIYALSTPNQYTEPLSSDYGWHIFQLVELKSPKQKDLSAVRGEVEARYRRDTADRLFSVQGEELANLTYENPKSLTLASEKLNLPINTTEYFTRQDGTGIASEKAVRDAAFSDEVLTQQHNSSTIRISDDSYVVIRLKDRQEQKPLPLSDVKAKIVSVLQKEAASAKAKQVGEQLLKEIKDNNVPNKIASNMKLEWHTSSNIEREDAKLPKGIVQQIFVMPRPEAGQAFVANGFQLPNGDYVVAALTKVIPGKIQSSEDSFLVEKLGEQLAILQGRLEFRSLEAELVKNADIKYLNQK